MADTLTLLLVVTFNLFSGIIALLVSYYAFQARRLIESSVLSAISFGFMLLGAALIVEVAITFSLGLTAAEIARSRGFDLLENLAYLVLQLVALLAIALGYSKVVFGRRGTTPQVASVAPGIVAYAAAAAKAAKPAKLAGLMLILFYLFLGLEFGILLILVFIVFQGFLVYSRSHERSSLLVLLAFALIFVAHAVVLHSILDISGTEYLVAAAIQFVGFLSLLAFVIRSGRIGSA